MDRIPQRKRMRKKLLSQIQNKDLDNFKMLSDYRLTNSILNTMRNYTLSGKKLLRIARNQGIANRDVINSDLYMNKFYMAKTLSAYMIPVGNDAAPKLSTIIELHTYNTENGMHIEY